jgi:ribose transport system substrate-binding protein
MARTNVLIALAMAAAVAAGCGSPEPVGGGAGDQGAGNAKYTIAVIPKGTTHEFWKSVHAGAVKASRETGIEVIWKGPLKEDDREAQIAVVENFVTRGVSGIVLAPLDDTALRPAVSNAVRSDIPVVIIDSDLQGDEHISFVATDNYKGGQLAGKEMARLLNGKGRIVVLRYQEGSASTTNREKGFLDEIARHPGIRVVSANQYGGATTESAYRASENLLAPLKKGGKLDIDGIFCPNESTTFGMLRALQDSKLAGTVRFIGFDSSEKLVQALSAGEIDALVLQDPFKMGYLGVKTLVDHLNGKEVPRRVDTGVTLVTRQNMQQPEIQQLLKPDLDQWLK